MMGTTMIYLDAIINIIISIMQMAYSNLPSVSWVIFLLLLFSVPLGASLIILSRKQFKNIFAFLLFSFITGFTIFCFLSYINLMMLHLSSYIPPLAVILSSLILWFYILIKKKNKLSLKDYYRKLSMLEFDKGSFLVALFIFALFLYYMYIPLTSYYSFTMDYDLFALGIKETSRPELPFYGLESYYPPLASLVSAEVSPFSHANMNKIMEILVFFIAFLNPIIFYFLGEGIFKGKGWVFSASYMLLASSRNHVGGGASFPAVLGIFFSIIFFVILLEILNFRQKGREDRKESRFEIALLILFASISLLLVALSHFDIFFPTIFGFGSLTLALLVSKRTGDIKTIFLLSLITLLIMAPFILHELKGSIDIRSEWSEEMIKEKNLGESHPLSVSRILFFQGFTFLPLFILGVISLFLMLLFNHKKDSSHARLLPLFLFFWLLTFILQNSMVFLNLATKFIHIYPLNIIMWSGTNIFFAIMAGIGAIYLINAMPRHRTAIIVVLVLLVCISFIDYETLNLQGIYRSDSSGLIKKGIINRQTSFGIGDKYCLEYARQSMDGPLTTAITLFSAYQIPIYTERISPIFFYETSYVSNSYIPETIEERFVFFPSTSDYYYLNESGKVIFDGTILCRSDGAKIIDIKKKGNIVQHFEIEKISSLPRKNYAYGISCNFTTVILSGNQTINLDSDISGDVRLHIKYLSSPFFRQPYIKAGEAGVKLYRFGRRSNKVEMVEDYVDISDWGNHFEIIPDRDYTALIPFEVDWIELEQRNYGTALNS